MNLSIKKNLGFSLLEIIIVMAIVALLASGAAVWLLGYYGQAETGSSAKEIVGVLREAQSRSMSGKDSKPWGVYFDNINNKVVLFRDDGGGYQTSSVKEETSLPSGVKISAVNLNGSGNEIIFSVLTGNTLQYGVADSNNTAVKIEDSNNPGNFRNIIVTPSGMVEARSAGSAPTGAYSAPSQVSGLTAVSLNSQTALSWTVPADNGSPITDYKIYRSTVSGLETYLANVGSATASYTDTGLSNGTTYYYKISAVNANGEGLQSDEVNAIFLWIDGFCGIQIYYADLSGTYQWKTTGTDCNTPQCGLDGGQDGDILVDPTVNPGVDFSEYPAQNACKAIGGRLPTQSEANCIYINQASLGSLQIGDYWTNAEYSSMSAWLQNSYGNGTNLSSKSGNFYVRCVR